MRFTKPAWVVHKDSSAKSDASKHLCIFSVHVHPDGSRIATGGLDAKIRIWSTKPILNPASEASNKPPKALSTLTMHTGPVLTVRWAHSGKWLASGSDDEIVMIWDFDSSARGKVWGSDEVNVEGWRPLKRLPGHESDVTDVAWSPGDRYLASVGLDSKVIIWCGYTHERLRKLDQHQGFVKGVCWDPVGEYLATQSDDRSVKIWNTTDWSLEAEITKPFEDSPGSTFFRRLSWSPDGAHITASNATNNKGFVFIASVITRNTWTSEISLVGHENTVEVASYNPHIFLRNPQLPVLTSNICSVVALGADDRSVSIWQTKSARPLIVAKEVFERQIMDLSWSWDGLTLYAVSSDGTLAVFNFDPYELEGICPHSVQGTYLKKFGFTAPPVPEGFSHASERPQLTPPPSPKAQSQSMDQTGFGGAAAAGGGERVNVLVAKRGGKKRAGLTTVPMTMAQQTQPQPSVSSGPGGSAFAGPALNGVSISKRAQLNQVQMQQQERAQSIFDVDSDNWGTSSDVRIDAVEGGRKRKTSTAAMVVDGEEPKRPRTLGGERKRVVVPVKEIAVASGSAARTPWSGSDIGMVNLPIPALMTRIATVVEGSDDIFEAVNPEGEGAPEVSYMSGKHTQWLDYLPSPALAVCASSRFCAVGMLDGSVIVYSHTGRRIMPSMSLGSPCSFIDGRRNVLQLITSTGQLHSWDVKKQSALFPSVSISTILSSPNYTITSAKVQPSGAAILTCSNGVVYSYDASLLSFVKLTERWWSEGSDVWQARQRSATNPTANRGVLSITEGSVAGNPEDSGADKKRPKWWNMAMTLGHLETRMHSARLLDSPTEYKQALAQYTKKIAEEGFRAKAEELIRDLFGPVYWRPDDQTWSPTVAGLVKRELLKDVLSAFARSKTLTKLAIEWQDVLKRAISEEADR
ncbi:WD40-repeat-containing domain protein [Mycena sp. CBHHK59/15]|nr:WD40-repeat-containing domain protein [Mycena sp. CBHHK59/15]KAJ6616420.1 WD40-repeat-containing domain protein [Mycena sp. CBHHK59/15]